MQLAQSNLNWTKYWLGHQKFCLLFMCATIGYYRKYLSIYYIIKTTNNQRSRLAMQNPMKSNVQD
jgi:hypothetical protein